MTSRLATVPHDCSLACCRSTQRLQQAQATILETQEIGIGVIDTMQQQRETLIRSKDKVSAATWALNAVRLCSLTCVLSCAARQPLEL